MIGIGREDEEMRGMCGALISAPAILDCDEGGREGPFFRPCVDMKVGPKPRAAATHPTVEPMVVPNPMCVSRRLGE